VVRRKAAKRLAMISLDQIGFLGKGLKRPECVLATAAGALYVSDRDGGVTRIASNGDQRRLRAAGDIDLKPNGITLRPDGSFLIAHLGAEAGGVFQLQPSGEVMPLLLEVEGEPLPPTNFVLEDGHGRVWITISTRAVPRHLGYRPGDGDGFIVLSDYRGARFVADGLGYTNELALSPDGAWLYVNETFARRLSRFRLREDGALGARETVAEFGAGTFPDGLAFDETGAVWVVSIVSNRVIRITPEGDQETLLEDCDEAHLAWVEEAYLAGTMGRPHLDRVESRRLRNISSIAFGGPDLRQVYLGCLLGERLATFRSPVAGLPPPHWRRRGF
jgi:sugar lactone lactonase YvrE